MPYGFKLETEENLLKKDEKRKKGYLHRKHKKFGNSSILENTVDNDNNIEMNNDNSNINNNTALEKGQKQKRRKKSFSSHNTENKEIIIINQ